jgi:hypothetical protein
MEKSLDILALELRNNLVTLVSGSTLPPSLTYYIVKDIYNMTEKEYSKIMDQYIGFIPAGSDKMEIIGGDEENDKSEE